MTGAAMVAGCTASDASPSPTPTSTTASSPEPSPSPTPSEPTVAKPARPAEMDRTDEVGAAAAAEYFLSMYAYVMQTGDFAEWDAMTTDACVFCQAVRTDATEILADGREYAGGEIALSNVEVGDFDDLLRAYPVKASMTLSESVEKGSDGALLARTEASRGTVVVEVIRHPDRWAVLAVVGDEA
ncbi:DUF6318 family protein [Cellulomonas fimi]|uniref:DUF6318 domain-containing protein n=1 Tax=Cellulomonas fimi TaxID=1708 RepID=A0A7Y0LYQ8_CELFI|nr:DUF6318 family protein [Cellulomonas fimi]NMR19858.1 hypothetical protein [Cellulomonas fimi]